MTLNVKIKKLHPSAKIPTYATDGSGCFDLYALLPRRREGQADLRPRHAE